MNKEELRERAIPFCLDYSAAGNAALMLWIPKDFVTEDKPSSLSVGDRYYEYGYAIRQIQKYSGQKRVLDIGSTGSVLPVILSALGYSVTCTDVRKWDLIYPNIKWAIGDFPADKNLLDGENFDVITAISAIEHFGLGRYGDSIDVDGDFRMMNFLKSKLNTKGVMILTIPYGNPMVVYPAHRIYDRSRYLELVSGMSIADEEYFAPIEKSDSYQPCTEEQTKQVKDYYGIICSTLVRDG